MFNKLPKYVRIVSSCSVDKFKSQLDKHLRNTVDLSCQPGFNNSLDGVDCLNGGHYMDHKQTSKVCMMNVLNTLKTSDGMSITVVTEPVYLTILFHRKIVDNFAH